MILRVVHSPPQNKRPNRKDTPQELNLKLPTLKKKQEFTTIKCFKIVVGELVALVQN